MTGKSINEAGSYTFEPMAPGSANEPPIVPAGAFKPTITSVVPNTCPVGGADITVVVSGTGFFSKSVCFVGGVVRATVFNSGTGKLSVTFKPATRTPGTVQVIVRNGVYPSNPMPFVFTATQGAQDAVSTADVEE